jgi:hypothetical protein
MKKYYVMSAENENVYAMYNLKNYYEKIKNNSRT